MPNHVTTILEAPKEVLDALKGEKSEVDFNSVIPFPEKLEKITAEVQVVETQEEADAINRQMNARDAAFAPEMRDLLGIPEGGRIHAITEEQQDILLREYGALDWYRWNTSHWGTKWNAYDIERVSDTELKVDTAWAHPQPVIDALAAKFPEVHIHVKYADEDLGSNLGQYTIQGTERVEELMTPEQTLAFAVEVKYGQTLEEYVQEYATDDPEYAEYLANRFGVKLPPKAIEA